MINFTLKSDLHLEFLKSNDIPVDMHTTISDLDFQVLAGDIVPILLKDHNEYQTVKDRFFALVMPMLEVSDVVWVPGNHEYYNSVIEDAHIIGDEWAAEATANSKHRLYFLYEGSQKDGQLISTDKYVLFGGSCWTDMDNGNPIVMNRARSVMNDYSVIQSYYNDHNGQKRRGKLLADTTYKIHQHFLMELKEQLSIKAKMDAEGDTRPFIVVSHHAPSFKSCEHGYSHENDYYYASKLEYLMLEDTSNRPPDVWIHGHTHATENYVIGNTLVLANARGYDMGKGPQNLEYERNFGYSLE